MQTYTVYELQDGRDQALYIGYTAWIIRRLEQHSEEKPWWKHVRRIVLHNFDTQDAAIKWERHLIEKKQPSYNVAGVRSRYIPPRRLADEGIS